LSLHIFSYSSYIDVTNKFTDRWGPHFLPTTGRHGELLTQPLQRLCEHRLLEGMDSRTGEQKFCILVRLKQAWGDRSRTIRGLESMLTAPVQGRVYALVPGFLLGLSRMHHFTCICVTVDIRATKPRLERQSEEAM
jgi:hypothetical protein